MALPEPVPGLVIRYSYLWESEAQRGQEEGLKDRPCAIVLTVRRAEQDPPRVVVAPITHTPPLDPRDAIEIPPKVGQALGLDYAKSWIVTREVNTFTWPGPDIRNADRDRFAFGRLPHKIAEQVRQDVLEKRTKAVNRDEPSSVATKDWSAKVSDKPREIKPLPRNPDKRRDR